MMKEQVIIQPISISKRGQQNFFQVKLPRDTHRIIGIETGLYLLNVPGYVIPASEQSMLMRRNNLMGVVKLRANGKPDVFYSKEVFERDINISAGEMKIVPPPVVSEERTPLRKLDEQPDGNSFDYFTHWTHGAKREEDPLNICGCAFINGQYKDAIGEYFYMDVSYKIMLYIWIERKTNQQQ
ncbi:hypothetical protein PDL71_10740 [Lacibacter sp. MH-610]|uniref:hypothetical protein n=1 Tax=Chitinophagaceae TaxID=563835 RepID=UPI001AD00AC7|nr:hypothetical protein [Chitinophagales bacterium]